MSRSYSSLFSRTRVAFRAPEGEISRTRQSDKEDADINVIVGRFLRTGVVPTGVRTPQSGDFTNVMDFKSAMNGIAVATEAFEALPSSVREKFRNDPSLFFDFCTERDDKGVLRNLQEMRRLKLAVPEAAPPVVPPPAEVKIANMDELKDMLSVDEPGPLSRGRRK